MYCFLGSDLCILTSMAAPAVSLQQMLSQVLDWVSRGKKTLKKPTKFQVRDGKF